MAVGLLFSGQGSQRSGMGEPWRNTAAWALTGALSEFSGHDIADLLLNADDETLKRTDRAQISTFALEMIALEHARPADVIACAGHSLGEYSALVGAGTLALDEATKLVAARGAAMLDAAEQNPGTMIAVLGPTEDDVNDMLAKLHADGARVWIANLNAPGQTVLAGDEDGIAAATEACKALPRTKTRSLPVGGAFHSPLMDPAATALQAALGKARFVTSTIPVVANLDALPHWGGDEWPYLLAKQLMAPVRWTDSVNALVNLGSTGFVEVGPGDTLSGMVKRIARDVPCTVIQP